MSGALNLIIARGFDSPIQGALNSYNNQRQAQEGIESANINQQGAMQNQQWQVEDRALGEQARQKAAQRAQEQEALLAMIPEIDARLRANPDDQEARAAAVQIHSRLNPEKASEGISGLLYPKQSGPQSALGKLGADLAAGRISQADYDAAAKKATYIAPPSAITQSEPLVAVQTPDGPMMMPRSQAAGMPPAVKPEKPVSTISQKEMATARTKVAQAKVARAQLAKARKAFESLRGAVSAGPFGAGKIPTEAGRKFDAAIDTARNTVTGIFRVPGIGAMSDFETRLQQAAFPDRNDYESVTVQKMNDLDAMIGELESGYQDMLAPASETDGGPKIGTVDSGYRFKGGNPADPQNWVKAK